MRAHCDNARQLAEFLRGHPGVKAVVDSPGLAGDTSHAIAKQEMSCFGDMFSFERKGEASCDDRCGEDRVVNPHLKVWRRRKPDRNHASIEESDSTVTDGLIRISAGLEHIDDLLDDLSDTRAEGPWKPGFWS